MRDDIVQAATALLDEESREDAVTLRSVARRVGITPPSIYAHFPDRESILLAVVQDAFAELKTLMETAAEAAGDDEVVRLTAVTAAYLDFALQRPVRYRILFGGLYSAARAQDTPTVKDEATTVGLDVFQVLVDALTACSQAGRSRSTDPFADAAAVWAGLHGLASLRPANLMFPWPEGLLDTLLSRLALLEPA